MKRSSVLVLMSLLTLLGVPLLFTEYVYAAPGSVGQVESFIRNVITVITGLAGLVATGFFVGGGFIYITSAGNPERMDKGKRTLTWAAIGLAITIGAFVISNIVTELATNAFGS